MNSHSLREHLVWFYFHLGGIAGGSFALASLIAALGGPAAPVIARTALLGAPVLLATCGGLLTVHLTRPERFWRVLTRFKWYSPISVGAWGLTLLSLVSVGIAGLLVAGVAPDPHASGLVAALFFVGATLAWFVAAYTGVLLTASSRRVWTQTSLLGAVFCVTGLACGAAWLRLLLPLGTSLGGAPVSAADLAAAGLRLEAMALRLTLLAAALWVYQESQVRALPEFRPWRRLFWAGLLFGYVLPLPLLDLGGVASWAGVGLVLTAGAAPRAALFFAGERPAA